MLLTVAEYLTAVSHTQIIENYKGELLHVPQICVQMLHKDSQAICETNKMHVVIKLNRQQISANKNDKKTIVNMIQSYENITNMQMLT